MATTPAGSVVPTLVNLDYNLSAAPGSVLVDPSASVDAAELPDAPVPQVATDTTERPTPRPRLLPKIGSPTDPRHAFAAPSIGQAAGARANMAPGLPRNAASPNWRVDNQYVRSNSVMNGADRKVMADLMSSRVNQGTVDYIQKRTAEVGPRYLAEMDTYLRYQNDRGKPWATYGLAETLVKGGVCRDQMGFMTSMLRGAGYDSRLIGYVSADNTSHAVTLFKDKATGKWNFLEYGEVHELGANTAGEAMRAFVPGALAFDIYSTDETKSVISKSYTDSGLRLFGAMSGADQPAPIGQSGAAVGSDGAAATVALDANTNAFVRTFRGNGLDGTTIGGIAHRFGANTTATIGGGERSVEERDIGPRNLFTEKYKLAFASVQTAGDIYARPLAPNLRFESNYDAAVNVGLAFGNNGFDRAESAALADTRANVNARVVYDVNENLRVYGGGTLGVGTATAMYFATGGRNIGELPLNKRFSAGVNYTASNFFIDANADVPVGKQADNLHDRPAIDISAGYVKDAWKLRAGARASMGGASEYLPAFATNGPNLDVVYAGVEHAFGNVTAGVEAYRSSQPGYTGGGVQASVRMSTATVANVVGKIFR